MEPGLIIRPARASDRRAMERICAHTWERGDYIPEVWDEWLADGRGSVIVGEVGKRVVALSRIVFQTPDQVWLEGMRVDPDYRGRGIATRFLDYSLAYAWQHGTQIVRLGTSNRNEAVQRMVGRAGMARVGTYVLWAAGPLAKGELPLVLTSGHAAEVTSFLQASPLRGCIPDLYSVDWVWQELTATQLARFLDRGEIVARRSQEGTLAAVALVVQEQYDGVTWIGFLDGQAAAVTELARSIRVQAAQAGAARVEMMLPDVAWLREAVAAAGFGFGDWEGELWIFERRLSPPSSSLAAANSDVLTESRSRS